MEIVLVLTILAVAVILFATEWIRMDLVSLLVLLAVGLTGLVSVEEAFSGFSNPAVITVAAMFVISAGIASTGATGKLGEKLLQVAGASETRLIIVIMLTVACFSAFINNIGSTAVLMPLVISMGRKAHIPPSKLLIPLAFGSLMGGVCTLIGTPPNILMNALMEQYSGESFSMFDFTPVGVAILIAGTLYMAFIGRHLLPTRKAGTLTEAYQVKEYITEVEILEGSPLDGKAISASGLESDFNLKVRAILREKEKIPAPRRNRKLRVGDILFLEGNPEGILRVRKKKGLQVVPERDNPTDIESQEEIVVVEASLTQQSELVGKTLRQVRFADSHGLTVLALWRAGAPVVKKVDHVMLRVGDVLLLQGREEKVLYLGRQRGFLLLGGVPSVSYYPRRAPIALLTLVGVIVLAALGILPIMLSATLGAAVMVLTRCLTLTEAYESIDWSIIMLIAGTLPLGLAMENSGAARFLADQIITGVGPYGPWMVLGAVFLITFALTEVMSHAAAAVLVAPIAFNTAVDLAASPKPFFMAVAIAASSCFMTPISHQSNALVMGPGGYRFFDYTKVGTALNFGIWILATALIPLVFPF
ncbi:membrane protein [Desulfuromonas versatilis]|uniref:Membrane protein n=1 Tax=Desulfuromonas versatilis TaxID=2802975 RepID=A0ABM8HTF3_9BACT|nr:SLC13 family permease [Desulfuromonas versatilis]BCR06240.1 membrane protein [Desulfuromonas versatilis]